MGLLDDAIREHLELKRRHGADPEEVSRQEREALGAPQRAEFAQPAGDEAAEEPAGAVNEVEEELREDEEPELAAEPAAVAAEAPEEDPWFPDEVQEEEPPTEVVAPDAEGEDVLEETPEFLQETPEHDRLWFEQKPPRDFDWDK
jgi:hypothetical protein